MLRVAAAAAAVCLSLGVTAVTNPEEYVDIRSGTAGVFQLSGGNLLPVVTTPWAFNGWSLYTATDNGWWWNPHDRYFYGLRCTHRPSPWINDWGHFSFLALMQGGSNDQPYQMNAFTEYDVKATTWSPYYFRTEFGSVSNENGVTALEFAPTSHAGVMRVTYPAATHYPTSLYDETRVLRFNLPTGMDTMKFTKTGSTVYASGYTMSETQPTNQLKMFIVAEITTDATYIDASYNTLAQAGILKYKPNGNVFNIKVATSLISEAQAKLNLQREVGNATVESVRAEAKKEWNKLLTTIDVTPIADTDDTLTIFYSSFYRAAQFPRFLSEYDASGKEVHFSTYSNQYKRLKAYATDDASGNVFDGPLVTDSGFWDAYRTVYPFVNLVSTDVLGRMIQGWLNAYKEGGWLPKWASPGYRDGMVGTMGDVVIADAIVNEVPGFDVDTALAAIMHDAFNASSDPSQGREDLADYLKLGYLPQGQRENVAVTLNFMLSDYAIAQAAHKLGKQPQQADELLKRSSRYGLLFHSDGFFRSKDYSGKFIEPFDRLAWGGSYTESGPWQYRFYVPHDPEGLAALYKKNGLDMCQELLKAQTMPSGFHLGSYSLIHEMTEMSNNCWGQYAHNNQPVHYMLWMFGAISDRMSSPCAQTGQYWLRKAQTELYRTGFSMYPGDEDNGEMSAWYLLSSLGLYALTPSSGRLSLGMPLFRKAVLRLPTGKTLTITSDEPVPASGSMRHPQDATTYPAVGRVLFNGRDVTATSLSHKDVMQGGTLAYHIVNVKKTW